MKTDWIAWMRRLAMFLGFCAAAQLAMAADFPRAAVPEPLKTWVPWALDEAPEAACPHLFNSDAPRQCAWPGALELKADAQGGAFVQHWRVYRPAWVALPGDARHWPQEVQVDGKPAPVIGRDGAPSVYLAAGSHRIGGRFVWRALPESLALPERAALLRLELSGKAVARPVRDEENRLWLQGRSEREAGDEAQIRVYRKLDDGIPVEVETRIHLEVSGKARELTLARALLPGALPLELRSPLQAALTQDGDLRVQARAGSWNITLLARYPGAVKTMTLAAAGAAHDKDKAGAADAANGDASEAAEASSDNASNNAPAGGETLLADEEVWSFQANPSIRSATVEGVAAVDPQQTDLPAEWRRLPGYLVRPGDTLTLKEIRRGDSEPAPDRLSVERQAWLSFDGSALTVSDRLSGEIGRARRLDVAAPARLGRVDINGQAQLITRGAGGAEDVAGVEVKRGALTMRADSELPGAPRRFSAVGWQHDAERLAMTLNLPAGWRLLHASGADSASGAWLAQWNLLDFFLVMLTALAAGRLWGVGWGFTALLAMALAYQEPGAPSWGWLLLIAAVALYRALPEGRVKRWMHFVRCAGALLLALHLFGFAVEQVRTAIYPVLEGGGYREIRAAQGGAEEGAVGARLRARSMVAEEVAQTQEMQEMQKMHEADDARTRKALPMSEPEADMDMPASAPEPEADMLASAPAPVPAVAPSHSAKFARSARPASLSSARGAKAQTTRRVYQVADPDAKVQTGPGLPDWRWNLHRLTWNGPVAQGQTLDLWLLSPLVNKLLVVLRLALLAGLLARILDLTRRGRDDGAAGAGQGDRVDSAGRAVRPGKLGWLTWPERAQSAQSAQSGRAAPSALLLAVWLGAAGVLSLGSNAPARAALPDDAMLESLREKLTRPAECLPECADISRLSVHLAEGSLRLVLDVDAAGEVALPLPGGAKQWLASAARVDGAPAYVYVENGGAWLLAPAGRSRIELIGALPAADVVQLPLPLRPRRVEVQAEGWEVAGISEESGVADTLQLSRRAAGGDAAKPGPADGQNDAAALPPFLRVERHLVFDLNWRVETTVRRLSPPGVPVVVQVPLLPGESVTTPGIVVKDGKAQVNLAPQAESLGWVSTLERREELMLDAPKTDAWVERWMLSASPLWHVDTQGFPPVALGASKTPEPSEADADLIFSPWPGESLRLAITRPQAAPGQTLTLEASSLAVTAGARSSDYRLKLSLRSSRGADHALTLPEGASLQRVAIDGRAQPIRTEADGRRLTLPVTPGEQNVEILWRAEQPMRLRYATQRPDLGLDSVNHRVQLQLPRDRWLLFAVGPGLGPAILFWGKLLVLFAVAIVLGRFSARRTDWPLRQTWQWLLLALGLTQAPWWSALTVVGWFVAFGWRARQRADASDVPPMPEAGQGRLSTLSAKFSHWPFNLRQIGLALLTLAMLAALFAIVESGLLGYPDMQVVGNGSSDFRLNWYLDRAGATPPGVWLLTLPMLVYRALMLLWALWLAWLLLDWLKWGWNAFSAGGLWRRKRRIQTASPTAGSENS